MGRQAPSEVSLSKAALLRAESQQEGLVAEPLASLRVESNHQALRLDNGRVLPVDLREHRLEDILWDQVLAEEVELVLAQHAVDVPADLGRFEEVVHGVAEARAVLDVHVAIHLVVAHGEVDVRLPPVRGLQLENERLLGGGGVLREDHIRLEREHVACRLAPVRQASCLARDHLWWPVHHPTEHTELVALANIHGLALHGLDCVDDIDLERDGEDGVDEVVVFSLLRSFPIPLADPIPLAGFEALRFVSACGRASTAKGAPTTATSLGFFAQHANIAQRAGKAGGKGGALDWAWAGARAGERSGAG
eukprot:CAMPEP_0179866882 /NCGR_PEP_ID=MMETSP0982-20121206/17791_1 /TAXON_ID=483367 /ORGANISM="non described non described, Strain CCMP 2436" /LENGTH=306 /DNA_ID=CAMNT_0021756039 /DNA_START=186 /DNA_END=1103 /DNA_ORIENTATION=-